jgi:hypothetical protein
VRTEPADRVTVFTGAPSQDQGHETVVAQICADQIGAPLDKITALGGDASLMAPPYADRLRRSAAGRLVEHKQYIVRRGEDMPEVRPHARPAGTATEEGDQLPMPAQQCVGRDDRIQLAVLA